MDAFTYEYLQSVNQLVSVLSSFIKSVVVRLKENV